MKRCFSTLFSIGWKLKKGEEARAGSIAGSYPFRIASCCMRAWRMDASAGHGGNVIITISIDIKEEKKTMLRVAKKPSLLIFLECPFFVTLHEPERLIGIAMSWGFEKYKWAGLWKRGIPKSSVEKKAMPILPSLQQPMRNLILFYSCHHLNCAFRRGKEK